MANNREREKILKEMNELFQKSPSQKEIIQFRKKARRVNLKLPTELRRKFCHHCNSLLIGRIRLNKGKKVILCEKCKKYTRIPFKTS